MTIAILHLSDIHIKNSSDPILQNGDKIAACVYTSLPPASHVFIVISGDIAFSGKKTEYQVAANFLKKIKENIEKERNLPIRFIIVPGNHDCDFAQNTSSRRLVIQNLQNDKQPSIDIDNDLIDVCTKVQEPFFEFQKELEEMDVEDKLWRTFKATIGNKVISFESLNFSWMSSLKENPGTLYFPIDRYKNKNTNDVDVRLVILHQPPNWFKQSVYRDIRRFIRKISDITISGHEHQGGAGQVSEEESGASIFIEGCPLQNEPNLSDSSFNLLILDLENPHLERTEYCWNGSMYTSKKPHSYKLPTKTKNIFSLTDSFQTILDDPGAFLKHPGTEKINLSDIFVYPDMKPDNKDNQKPKYINSVNLRNPEITAKGVLIRGDEKVGSTSLMLQLYKWYYDHNFIPIFIKGKDLGKKSDPGINAVIKHSFEEQYGRENFHIFEQESLSKKLLLVDDFDDSPMKDVDGRTHILSAFRKRFGHLVITVSEIFEIRELLDNSSKYQELATLEHFQLLPFGYALRSSLIKRWFRLYKNGTLNEEQFIARCDEAERLMDNVIIKTVTPSLPFYLLILLQMMEAGHSVDFRGSGLGHYYQYVLTQAFTTAGVKPDKLNEVFTYTSHLAWEFHSQKCGHSNELSDRKLRDFNENFSKSWTRTDFDQRIKELLKAGILCRLGNDYKFRYPYIYYYFKGMYLNNNITTPDSKDHIERCIKCLHVKDYANTMLFLAHYPNDNYLLTRIIESLQGLFQNCEPVSFGSKTIVVKKLIEDAPQLIYSGGKPVEENRERRDALLDKFDTQLERLDKNEEESSTEFSIIDQFTMLFKTTEILGQILKNQYASIQRNLKTSYLKELFNSLLRALGKFYDYFEKNPEALINEIDIVLKQKGKIKSEDKRRKIARKVVAQILELVSFLFIIKAIQAANSESLFENVGEVVEQNNTLAFRLIEIGIILDSPKPIPKNDLKNLYNDVKEDIITSRLLTIMVLKRLYFFKTSEKDMQWLSEHLNLNLDAQHKIAYQNNQKLLKK